jgi:DNA topoisomerase-1
MQLVIVESPSKIKTIKKYLTSLIKGVDFTVLASYGHIRDLEKGRIAVNETTFEPNYSIIPEKSKQITAIKEAASQAEMVWLASDLDREGEAIAWHIRAVIGKSVPDKKIKRITFNEITQSAIAKALENPRSIDQALVDAQKGRRVLDRIVGFKLTELLWKVFTRGSVVLSAGRVQSVVLDLLLQRENEICSFETESYWHVHGDFTLTVKGKKVPLNTTLVDKTLGTHARFSSETEVSSFFDHLKKNPDFALTEGKLSKVKSSPDKPFVTSTLQQEAFSKLGFGVQRTMKVAQELYEKGLITYMRTDDARLSEDFMTGLQKYITTQYGLDYFQNRNASKKKQQHSQEAHEAIRPTDLSVSELSGNETSDQKRLYSLIWKRTVASQMASAVYDELTLQIDSDFDETKTFVGKVKKLVFQGYLIVWNLQSSSEDTTTTTVDIASVLKTLEAGEEIPVIPNEISAKNTWSVPPSRYNESSVVKKMEQEGIGRPSTYGAILAKLFERNYIETKNIEGGERTYKDYSWNRKKVTVKEYQREWFHENSKIVPTAVGAQVNEFLRNTVPGIINAKFTSEMENNLDRIAHGKLEYRKMMSEFYQPFIKTLSSVDTTKEKKKLQTVEGQTYTVNSKEYTVRQARFGAVIEYTEAETKKYISLKPYLKVSKKGLSDIDEKDIAFIVSLPKVLKVINGHPLELLYGSYGFYLKHGSQTRSLYAKQVKQVRDNEIQSLIDYFFSENVIPKRGKSK